MKTGILMVIIAIALFSGSMIWSVQADAERDKYHLRQDSEVIEGTQSGNSRFIDCGPIASCFVTAPVNIELTDRFSGIQITGDTALINDIVVSKAKMPSGSNNVWIGIIKEGVEKSGKVNFEDASSALFKKIEAGDITITIGNANQPQEDNYMKFNNCKKVISRNTITGNYFISQFNQTDSIYLEVNVKNLMLENFGGNAESKRTMILKGKAEKARITAHQSSLNAAGLEVKDLYLKDCSNAQLDVFCTFILNAKLLNNCKLNFQGNPPYQRIQYADY